MGYPDKKEITRALKEIAKPEPTLVIDFENASKSDVLKYQICHEFVKIMHKENLTQAELARKLGVDRAIANKIVLHKIQVFTVDRLLDLLSKLTSVKVELSV